MKPPLQWVAGHRIGDGLHHFPHLCPGIGCAIAAWLTAKQSRATFEGLVGYQQPAGKADGRD